MSEAHRPIDARASHNGAARNTLRAVRPDIDLSIEAIRQALETMRFGAITLTVHDGRAVQLDVTEKRRFA